MQQYNYMCIHYGIVNNNENCQIGNCPILGIWLNILWYFHEAFIQQLNILQLYI